MTEDQTTTKPEAGALLPPVTGSTIIALAAARLVRRGPISRSNYRWWHQEVRKVIRGQYCPEYIKQGSKDHVLEAVAVSSNDQAEARRVSAPHETKKPL